MYSQYDQFMQKKNNISDINCLDIKRKLECLCIHVFILCSYFIFSSQNK